MWTPAVLLVAVIAAATEAAIIGPNPYFTAGFGLENELSYEHRENKAIARLYENVLDILQCLLPHEQGLRPTRDPDDIWVKQPVQDENWKSPRGLGPVAGVTVDHEGRPVIFHRGDHIWTYDSFDGDNRYTKHLDGPVPVNTVLTLNPENGEVVDAWGADAFYLPHGIHVDPSGNYWLTDVALHQVFKFPRRERMAGDDADDRSSEPSLVLGERFVPGSDSQHFCMPTAVAVMPSGEVVIADGYCNDRIVVLDQEGRFITQLPPRGSDELLRLRVPHSLTILKRGDVCVADREHQRIVCFNLTEALSRRHPDNERQLVPLQLHFNRPGVCRIFGITSHDDVLYAINGPTKANNPVMGFTVKPDRDSVVAVWGPTFASFTNPHEIAACPNGSALYVAEIGPNVVWKFRLLTN